MRGWEHLRCIGVKTSIVHIEGEGDGATEAKVLGFISYLDIMESAIFFCEMFWEQVELLLDEFG